MCYCNENASSGSSSYSPPVSIFRLYEADVGQIYQQVSAISYYAVDPKVMYNTYITSLTSPYSTQNYVFKHIVQSKYGTTDSWITMLNGWEKGTYVQHRVTPSKLLTNNSKIVANYLYFSSSSVCETYGCLFKYRAYTTR